MKSNTSNYQNKKEYRLFIQESYTNLVAFKTKGDKTAFNALVLEILPTLRNYINRGLNVFISNGHFSK